MRWLATLLLFWLGVAAAAPRIAIILDDFGYSPAQDRRALALPFAITCSVIPEAPHAIAMAGLAQRVGKQVLIHLPMATLDHRPLDPGGLHSNATQADITATVQAARAKLPMAVGLNNHMGSYLTRQHDPMTWLMQSLAREGLFFIDSLTSGGSVAMQAAREQGVPTRERDVFLDDEQDLAYINGQFNQLLDIARKRGSAIAIGHPYPATLDYLGRVLPLLGQAGIQLVPVSQLLPATKSP